jgi:hypothetical protein
MESATTNGSKSCKINKDIQKKLLVVERDFWRICLRIIRDEVHNEAITEDVETKNNKISDKKRLIMFVGRKINDHNTRLQNGVQ